MRTRLSTSRPGAAAAALGVLIVAAVTAGALAQGTTQTRGAAPAPASPAVGSPPPAFEPVQAPADNPTTPEKVALGRQLFFDKRLSGDGTRSCYSCHVCEKGLTDGLPTAVGAFGKSIPRSSPSLWNVAYHTQFYWDGRSPTMEKQALAAWSGANMGAKPEEVVAKLNAIPGYRDQFQKVFGSEATPDMVVMAISAFERTLFCGTTPFDRFQQGDQGAVTEAAKRGWKLWREKAGCGTCHAGILFTDLQYHNVGIGMDKPEPDVGRKKVTNDAKDTGAFKTPTLRDVAKSAPYFHDGSVATLSEAVDLMVGGGKPNPHLDTKNLQKVTLTPAEKADLMALLQSLSCDCTLREPPLP